MEWNWFWNGNGNDMTPFMLYESSGDSEEVKFINDDHHHDSKYRCHDDEATMINEYEEGVCFRYDDIEDIVIDDEDDDDAQSCSYDHSSYINTSYGNRHHDDQSSRRFSDVHDHDDDDDDDGSDNDDDDDDYKNWGESKLLDPSKKQNMSHKFCGGDSLNQRDADKQFWESCLAS